MEGQTTRSQKQHFQNFDKCRSKVAGDVVSCVAVDYVGTDAKQHLANLGYTVAELFDSLADWTRFTYHFCPVFNCILQLTGSKERSDVISGSFVETVIPNNRVKFGDPHMNFSQEIPPEAARGVIF